MAWSGTIPAPTADRLPATGGAYALLLRLAQPLTLPLPRLGRPRLLPGAYVYCGSANGPGGLRARVARHLRGSPRRHWHIDHLLAAAEVRDLAVVPGGTECALVARVAETRQAAYPVVGFGSTDCRRCTAHLLAVDPGFHWPDFQAQEQIT